MFSQLKTYCVTVCLLWIGVNCFDEWEAIHSDSEIEAPCMFDNDDAGRTCNCGFRNEVQLQKFIIAKCKFVNSFPIENVFTSNGW